MENEKFILGLDIGSNSIGWAMLGLGEDGKPCRIIKTGARIFEAGTEGHIESGRDESRNKARRDARHIRRQLWRRRRKRKKLLHILQRVGLLPEGEATEVIEKIDADFRKRYESQVGEHQLAQVLPYYLRKRALDEELKPYEFGRVLYHLGQRRGFKSNRRKPPAEGEEEKKRQEQTDQMDLADDVKKKLDSGELILGKYLVDFPAERIRNMWTSRKWYENEFNAIWKEQAQYHPGILTDELKEEIYNCIFFQRPLKPQIELVGECQFEREKKRAPMALPSAQRFRYLQKLNDLRIIPPKKKKVFSREEIPLEKEQREKLLGALERNKKLSFQDIRDLFGLKKNFKFNLQEGGEKSIHGNSTSAVLAEILGEGWHAMTLQEQDHLVEDIIEIEEKVASHYWRHAKEGRTATDTPEVEKELIAYSTDELKLSEQQAANFATVEFEDEYSSLSREAITKLLPEMETGTSYATAVKNVYGEEAVETGKLDFLPPVISEEAKRAIGELRNPVVTRALTELRKVVNAIIRQHGKPETVRIELAREMKKPRKEREAIWKKSRENEKKRETAKKDIESEIGISNPKSADILKAQLYKESNFHCPYCNRGFSWKELQQAEIDHIIPQSRSLDNSYVNKTLICWDCNHKKGNKTPFEAFGNSQEWDEIIERVKRFDGRENIVKEKLRRFEMKGKELDELLSNFTDQQLTDTKYASKVARNLLGLLYGGRAEKKGYVDEKGKLRVQAARGAITATLRNVWQLNFLGGGRKIREDHRHHAIDAIVTALTDPGKFKMLSRAAQFISKERIAGFAVEEIETPWDGFIEDVKKKIGNITVSHRVSKKVQGALHEATFYSPPRDEKGSRAEKGEYTHIRKKIENISTGDVEDIVDPAVREYVRNALVGKQPNDAFKEGANHPRLPSGVPVHKVRLRKHLKTIPIGKKERMRHVVTGSNHHIEIWREKNKKGREKWDGEVVTMLEAVRRKKAGEPIVRRNHGEGKEFLFSLAPGDIIKIQEEQRNIPIGLYRIRTVPQSKQLAFVNINEARNKIDIRKTGDWKTSMINTLKDLECQKVIVTPLGEVRRAND